MKVFDSIVRVSRMQGREESAESTKTIADQRRGNRAAAKEAGGRVGREFKLLDQSGRTIHRSGVYEELLRRVRDGKSDGVVVAYGDRLTRNWRRVGVFYDELETAGAEVVIAGMPGVDYRTTTGRMVTGMMAVVSDMVGAQAKDRGDKLADAAAAEGILNVVPYGYRRNLVNGVKTLPDEPEKRLVPDEQTAPVVRRIFDMREAGQSWASIAQALNADGIPSPSGGHWVHGTLGSLVRNEAYIGVVKLGKRRNESAHEALVSRVQFRAVKQARKISPSGFYAGGLAMGIATCSGCGKTLSVRGLAPEHRKNGNRGSQTYGCRRSSRDGSCERPVYVTKDRVDDFVDEQIEALLGRGRGVGIVSSSRDLEARRQAWEAAKEETAVFVETVSAADPHFLRGKVARQDREERAREQYEELAAQAEDAEQIPSPSAWQGLSLERKRQVARLLIDRVEVAPPASRSRFADVTERLTIVWRGGQ